ncbi:dynein regulatory complex subunit 5-like [Metopolophium dirhodum]|uniref:dynein regulatory complex subunit 5-like n=1 Tax=Metopolophium dirhodum TaxID=44670 RepID=UPI0029904A0F|nr:dynein regulatory complex subunit 5-like [Metopolophium dirhodum]
MWIPHTIPKTTFHLFIPSDEIASCRLLLNEVEHVVSSVNFSWADCMPKPLKLLCLDNIANHFSWYPDQLFEWITPINTEYLVETLSTSLPLSLVIHVPGDEYWRRRYADTWPNCIKSTRNPAVVTDSVKIIYITKYVSEIIENLEPGYVDETELSEILMVCSPYVTAIDCQQLRIQGSMIQTLAIDEPKGILPHDPIHIDMSFVLGILKNIRTLSLVYGSRTFTTKPPMYTPEQYMFNIDDMDTLGCGLVISEHLTSLAITKSELNMPKFNRLLPYLMECHGLEEINFSFCKLSSLGGKSVAHFVKTAKMLKLVNLCGNNIGPDGVESLSFVMLWRRNNNYPAIELNLNMNNISDIGAKYLASALASGVQPLTKLRVRNCNITEIGGINIAQSLAYDRGLRALEIDNNPLTLEVAIALHTTLKTNLNIAYISIQNCNFPQSITNFLSRVAFYNRHGKRSELIYVDLEYLCYDDDVEQENISLEEGTMESETMENDVKD